jgi:hypothetical protein
MVAAPVLVLAQSNNVDLFHFLMPDAQLIAGIHVDSAKNSPFGQFVLTHLPMGGSQLATFISETGVDPLTDIQEVLVGWNGGTDTSARWLVAAHGNFMASIEVIEVNALKNGATITRMPGADLVTVSTQPSICIGMFTDGGTDLGGDCTSVATAIQFGAQTGSPMSAVAMTAQQLRAAQDLWFASVVPVSEIAGFIPGAITGGSASGGINPGAILKNPLFQAIQEISGGVKLNGLGGGVGAQLSAAVLMNSPQNATSLLNVVNFIAGMLQSAAGTGSAGGSIATLLGNLQASVNGSTVNIELGVPEGTLEQLFEQAGQLAMNPAVRGR